MSTTTDSANSSHLNLATQARIDRIFRHVAFAGMSEDNRRGIGALIEQALREQDRDTRHACAEAVSALHSASIYRETVTNAKFDPINVIINRAHSACMNARAI